MNLKKKNNIEPLSILCSKIMKIRGIRNFQMWFQKEKIEELSNV